MRRQVAAIEGNEVTRLWSNAAAAADARPCVPAPPGPAFGAVPTPMALSLAPGQAGSASALVYTTGPLPPLTLVAYAFGEVDVTPASGTVGNGDTVALTIAARAGAASGSQATVVLSLLGADDESYAYVAVTVR